MQQRSHTRPSAASLAAPAAAATAAGSCDCATRQRRKCNQLQDLQTIQCDVTEVPGAQKRHHSIGHQHRDPQDGDAIGLRTWRTKVSQAGFLVALVLLTSDDPCHRRRGADGSPFLTLLTPHREGFNTTCTLPRFGCGGPTATAASPAPNRHQNYPPKVLCTPTSLPLVEPAPSPAAIQPTSAAPASPAAATACAQTLGLLGHDSCTHPAYAPPTKLHKHAAPTCTCRRRQSNKLPSPPPANTLKTTNPYPPLFPR